MSANNSMSAMKQNEIKQHWLNKLCRQQVHKVLADLQTGCIEICDGSGDMLFGDEQNTKFRCQLTVTDWEAYRSIALKGSVGAGESYMTGDWSCDNLPMLIRILSLNKDQVDAMDSGWARIGKAALQVFHFFNRNTEKGSKRNIAAHYDLGNDLFELFLDSTMMYSSGIFPADDATMEEASIYKLDRICKKLQLTPDEHLVEIGTGWGSMAIHAAKYYGCKVTTTTISEEQYDYAAQKIKEEGLGDKITLLKKDYRLLEGKFDKLVSIEMIEAVGYQYLDTYIEKCGSLLKDDGVALIQAITIDDQRYEQAKKEVDFIKRYIFPGSFIPCVTAIQSAVTNNTDMKMTHLEDITPHYAKTLACWREAFLDNKDKILSLGYDETFIRLWDFYFAYCEGGFAERVIGDVHLMFSKPMNRRTPVLGILS